LEIAAAMVSEPADPPRVSQGEVLRDHSAHRLPHHDRRSVPHGVPQDRRGVIGQGGQRVRTPGTRRLAGAAVVDEHYAER